MNDKPHISHAAILLKELTEHGFQTRAEPNRHPSWQPDLQELWNRFRIQEKPRLRLSFGARCARQKWYAHNEPDHATLPGKVRLTFSQGDLWEALALATLEGALEDNPEWSLLEDGNQKLVNMSGITGHIDGILCYKGEPYCLIDTKQTSKWVFKKWEEGRKPDETWGYRHQAANYLAALREEMPTLVGMIWLVCLREYNDIETGWMTAEELHPYELESRQVFRVAHLPTPPVRCAGFPNAVPCAGKTKKYCDFFNHCHKDER